MSKIITRPDHISYYSLEEGREEDINKLENENALIQWEKPRAFMWHEGPWLHHLKIVSVSFILAMLPVFFMGAVESLNLLLGWISIICIMPLAFIYYISRSQYYYVAYRISDSGILIDILKIYPRFRYGLQDTTKVMHFTYYCICINYCCACCRSALFNWCWRSSVCKFYETCCR